MSFWSTGSWGICSAQCGGGVIARSVTCVNSEEQEVTANLCSTDSKPVEAQSCNTHDCPRGGGRG